jgi:hypothetical protein
MAGHSMSIWFARVGFQLVVYATSIPIGKIEMAQVAGVSKPSPATPAKRNSRF